MKIYRCGWCGLPTDENGNPLEGDEFKEAELAIFEGAPFEHVQGACCPNGNESQNMV